VVLLASAVKYWRLNLPDHPKHVDVGVVGPHPAGHPPHSSCARFSRITRAM